MNDDRTQIVKQVKEANDIVSVVGAYLSLRQVGSKHMGLCPFHDDSRPSLTVDPKWQNFKCWACGKSGDVITFVQDYDKISFKEALEQLARRAGIVLEQYRRPEDAGKLRLIDALQWAAHLYQQCYFEDANAEAARLYLGQRKLLGETIRRFGVGFAPGSGDWLARQASRAPVPVEVLVEAGLLATSSYGSGYYDRFRDRVMFPIRDLKGQVVGFGGRILPDSPHATRAPKYYNSSDSPVFNKSELVYGLDLARLAAQANGCLAVVEGYTDVLMAHQAGVTNVVATMGTALTAQHVRQLRRFVPRVALVYDADAGGSTGVDRALELFIREDMDLAIATLPAGMDPCDLIVAQGPEPLRSAISGAADVLDYKIEQLLHPELGGGVEDGRRAVEAVLGILALAPDATSAATQMRRELVLNRVAHRFGLRHETLHQRLVELRKRRPRDAEARPNGHVDEVAVTANVEGTAKADPLERQLIEVLLAQPDLVARANAVIAPEQLQHPGLQRLLSELYDLQNQGQNPDLDSLRLRLVDKPKLAEFALRARAVGLEHKNRSQWLAHVLEAFGDRAHRASATDLKSQLKSADDPSVALALLKKLQEQARPAGDIGLKAKAASV